MGGVIMTRLPILLTLVCGLALVACGRVEKAGEADVAERVDVGPTPDACVPYCGAEGEAECGDDGCGGTCGKCDPGAVCGEADYAAIGICFSDTEQCPVICDGHECGHVWTGLWEPESCDCGTCEAGFECVEDEEGNYCVDPDCTGEGCPPDKCWEGLEGEHGLGALCSEDSDCDTGLCAHPKDETPFCTYLCHDCCPTGHTCAQLPVDSPDVFFACLPDCQPDCTGKECGDDGCGGICGPCAEGCQCIDGVCEAACECVPYCGDEWDKFECGDDGCGGSCGECEEGAECVETDGGGFWVCFDPVKTCQEACEADGNECGFVDYVFLWVRWELGCECGECPEGQVCVEGGQTGNLCCSPSCGSKECGDDGCGGSCGECDPGCPLPTICDSGVCLATCEPLCDGKECGDDGCGCPCGECDDGKPCTDDSCVDGACQFTPSPDNTPCGDSDEPWAEDYQHCLQGVCCQPNVNWCWDGICDCEGWPMYGTCQSECDAIVDDTDWGAVCVWECGGDCCNTDADCPGDTSQCAQIPSLKYEGMWPTGRCVEPASYPACWWSSVECLEGELCVGAPTADDCPHCNVSCPNLKPGLCVPADLCGNGLVEPDLGETCDDGNTDDGDGCDGLCHTECVPSCEGKECGDDGCGGSCGECNDGDPCTTGDYCDADTGGCVNIPVECPEGQTCNEEGQCE